MCRRRAWVLVLLLMPWLASCATPRFYPVCLQSSTTTSPVEVWEHVRPDVARVIDLVVLGGVERTSLRSTGAVVMATAPEHEQLRLVWTNVACYVTQPNDPVERQLLQECLRVVDLYFLQEWRYWPALSSEVSLRCESAESFTAP